MVDFWAKEESNTCSISALVCQVVKIKVDANVHFNFGLLRRQNLGQHERHISTLVCLVVIIIAKEHFNFGLLRSQNQRRFLCGRYTFQLCSVGGRVGGQVVSILAFYSDDLCSNPFEAYSFFCKICLLKRTKINKKRPGLAHLKNFALCIIQNQCRYGRYISTLVF